MLIKTGKKQVLPAKAMARHVYIVASVLLTLVASTIATTFTASSLSPLPGKENETRTNCSFRTRVSTLQYMLQLSVCNAYCGTLLYVAIIYGAHLAVMLPEQRQRERDKERSLLLPDLGAHA